MESTRDASVVPQNLADKRNDAPPLLWPAHLQELCRDLLHPRDETSLTRTHADVWLLLNTVLGEYGRRVAARMRIISTEDVEDFAAEKALDLLEKIVRGDVDIVHRPAPALARFMSTVARNSLLNLTRRARRRVLPHDAERPEWDLGKSGEGQTMGMQASPDCPVERKEFAQALRLCADELRFRDRKVWFLRVFCALSSKEIASHPEVSLKPSHVDVLLQRVRKQIQVCMRSRGHEARDMPPGCLAEMWPLFRQEETCGSTEAPI